MRSYLQPPEFAASSDCLGRGVSHLSKIAQVYRMKSQLKHINQSACDRRSALSEALFGLLLTPFCLFVGPLDSGSVSLAASESFSSA